MNFLSPLPGLGFLLDAFPQLSLWATIARHSVAEIMANQFQNFSASLRLCVKTKP
jgi:hypothetical protein